MSFRTSIPTAVVLLLMDGSTIRAEGTGTSVPPSFEARVAARRAVEETLWRHRIWPASNPGAKPDPADLLSDKDLRAGVEDDLRKTQALAVLYGKQVTAADLQAELDRMSRDTHAPEVLADLFRSLGDDPSRIAETLARPALVDRLLRTEFESDPGLKSRDESFGAWWDRNRVRYEPSLPKAVAQYHFRQPEAVCVDGAWRSLPASGAPNVTESYSVVWTGAEAIVWGGSPYTNAGARYVPATDQWLPTSTVSAPAARASHSAVWTGTEMFVWGGYSGSVHYADGGRYDPGTNTWTLLSSAGSPPAERSIHTAVWTGTEMIAWGGTNSTGDLQTGGRFNAATDSWVATSTLDAPVQRFLPTAVWTGREMVIWGGYRTDWGVQTNLGSRYDPFSDTWRATYVSVSGTTPPESLYHTGVWTGAEMIVWGGRKANGALMNTARCYNPTFDTWRDAPPVALAPRHLAAGVWTGREMIVWGGINDIDSFEDGGRYRPAADVWSSIPPPFANEDSHQPPAIWTGDEMLVFTRSSGHFQGVGYCSRPSCFMGAAPTARPEVHVWQSGTRTDVVWPPSAGAETYDVVRGDLNELTASNGDFAVATHLCLANDRIDAWKADSGNPPAGEGYWYLVRPSNCAGEGTFDTTSPSQVAARDHGIGGSAGSCDP